MRTAANLEPDFKQSEYIQFAFIYCFHLHVVDTKQRRGMRVFSLQTKEKTPVITLQFVAISLQKSGIPLNYVQMKRRCKSFSESLYG